MIDIISPGGDKGIDERFVAAASAGHLELVKSLLAQGAYIEARDSAGDTAVNEAARKGHLDVLQYLLSQGAQSVSPNNEGKTALIWARENNNKEVVRFLESYLPTPWIKLDNSTIAFVKYWLSVQRKMTEVFNLASRERLLISENTLTHAEAITPPSSFDDLPPARLQEVIEHAKELGLNVDENFVLTSKTSLPKNKLN